MDKLFWGFFFLVLDFNLNFGAGSLNLLPNWLGFALLYLGCGELLGESELFQRPRPFCVGLAIYSAVVWLAELLGVGLNAQPVLWGALGCIVFALQLYIGWLVINALANVEMRRNYDLCSAHLRKVWLVWTVTGSAAYLLMIVPAIALLCAVAAAIVGIIFLVAVHGTRKAWRNMMDEQSRPL